MRHPLVLKYNSRGINRGATLTPQPFVVLVHCVPNTSVSVVHCALQVGHDLDYWFSVSVVLLRFAYFRGFGDLKKRETFIKAVSVYTGSILVMQN